MPGRLGRGILIKMALYSQPNLTSGIDQAIVTTSQSVSAFPIMVLFFIFFVVFLGGTANQKKRDGSADYPFWMVLSSLTITIVSLIFSLTIGIISNMTLGIVISITILSSIWFFTSKTRGEQ